MRLLLAITDICLVYEYDIYGTRNNAGLYWSLDRDDCIVTDSLALAMAVSFILHTMTQRLAQCPENSSHSQKC